MNRILTCTSALALAMTVVASLPARAGDRCVDARTMVDQRACHAADQGTTALRRFVERTRGIYDLYYWDYAPPERMRANVAGAAALLAERKQ